MSRNGYINATKMCQDGNKQFKHWLNNQGSIDLIEELVRSVGIPADLVMIKNGTGSNDYRGTYVHLDLVPHIASWISAKFAFKVSKIVNEYRIKEQKIKHAIIVGEKDDKISKLEAKIDSVLDELSKLSLDNKITHGKLDKVQNTLEDRVIKPINEGMTSTVLIL